MTKEEILERVKKKEINGKGKLERFKMKYKTILNWLCIDYHGKEEFWKQREDDGNNNNLDKYGYRLHEIVNENIFESFVRLRDKSTPAITKSRTKLLESKIFKERIKRSFYGKIAMKKGSFDLYVWNGLRKKMMKEVGNIN
jgi:hypothetical protein